MILDKAQKIKKRLLLFEGKQVEADKPKIWKVLLSDKDGDVQKLVHECLADFKADDITAALNYRSSFEIYIVYKDNDNYPFELYERFLLRNNLVL